MKIHGLFVLVVLLATRTANAQETLLRQAYELRRDGHDEAALPLLTQAYAADPSPRVAAQLALVEQATSSWQSASEHLRIALSAPNDPWIARHLDALEGSYALVLARLPRETVQRVEVPAASPVRIERTTIVRERPTVVVRSTTHFPARTVGWVTIGAGSALVIGGAVAWGLRYEIIQSFNDRGCLIGNPTMQPGCDTDTARSGRDVATALAITGAVTGVSLGAVGAALLLGAAHDNQRRTAWFCVPSSNGLHASLACSVQF